MMKRVEKHIQNTLKKTFKDYKAVNFSVTTQDIITKFVEEFINNLNKKINLDKAYKSTKSKETELIGNIEQAMLVGKVNGSDKALEEIKQLLAQYKGEGANENN